MSPQTAIAIYLAVLAAAVAYSAFLIIRFVRRTRAIRAANRAEIEAMLAHLANGDVPPDLSADASAATASQERSPRLLSRVIGARAARQDEARRHADLVLRVRAQAAAKAVLDTSEPQRSSGPATSSTSVVEWLDD